MRTWVYAKAVCGELPSLRVGGRIHLLSSRLATLTLQAARPTDIRAFLDAKEADGLNAQTVNHLRSFLSRAFNRAIEVGRWPGGNPVAQVKKRRVMKSAVGDYLRLEEVPRVLHELPPRWRPVFVAVLYTGMRKGELLALRKLLPRGSRRRWPAVLPEVPDKALA